MISVQDIEKANPRRELTTKETKRLAKLEAIADKLKRGENVQNKIIVTRYLHTKYFKIVNF